MQNQKKQFMQKIVNSFYLAFFQYLKQTKNIFFLI